MFWYGWMRVGSAINPFPCWESGTHSDPGPGITNFARSAVSRRQFITPSVRGTSQPPVGFLLDPRCVSHAPTVADQRSIRPPKKNSYLAGRKPSLPLALHL